MSEKKFVNQWLVTEISKFFAEHSHLVTSVLKEECNKYLYKKYPEVAQRTIRNATYLVHSGEFRTTVTQPHYMAMPTSGIVPKKYSEYNEYIARMKMLIDKCQHDHRRIRIVNVQDGHRETADPALFDLVLQVIDDFKPDYVPQMCDMVDNKLLAPYTHGTSYMQSNITLTDGDEDESPVSQAMKAFEYGTVQWAKDVRSVVGVDTILPVWLGNHEIWMLRYLHDHQEAAGYFFENFFAKLNQYDVLWTEGDVRKELPVTDNVFAIHGWAGGANAASKYLRHYGEQVSLFAGHSHRQETVWSKPHINTGSQNFVNICGTLGTVRPEYTQRGYSAHNHGFTLAYLAPSGNIGHEVIDVRIGYAEGYYRCYVSGKLYQEKATREPEFTNPFLTPLG